MMLDVGGVEFRYRSVPVLDDVSFSVGKAEMLSILGPNGVGKTTLLKCINGILKARKGTIMVDEESLTGMSRLEVAKRVGYVAQRSDTHGHRVRVGASRAEAVHPLGHHQG